MNNSPEATAALERLFRTYPSFAQGNTPEELMRDRIEKAKVYFEAIEPYDICDIEAAVRSFLTGSAPGHNPAFAPSAPAVGAEVRRLNLLRCTREARDRALRPALPPPEIERTPESQARVREMVERTVAGLKSSDVDDGPARHKARLQRTNAYFDQERSFTVGDPEGERDVA